MKITRDFNNGKYKFETYTSITEDMKDVSLIQSDVNIQEITTCKDENGNDAIFVNSGLGIIMYRLLTDSHTYKATFIEVQYRNIVVRSYYNHAGNFYFLIDGVKKNGSLYDLRRVTYTLGSSKPYSEEKLLSNIPKKPDGSPLEPLVLYDTDKNNKKTDLFVAAFDYKELSGKKAKHKYYYEVPGKSGSKESNKDINDYIYAHNISGTKWENYIYRYITHWQGPLVFQNEYVNGKSRNFRNAESLKGCNNYSLFSINHRDDKREKIINPYTFVSYQFNGNFYFAHYDDYSSMAIRTNIIFSGKEYTDCKIKAIRKNKLPTEFHIIARTKENLYHIIVDNNFKVISKFTLDKYTTAYNLVQDDDDLVLYYSGKCHLGKNAIIKLVYDKETGDWSKYIILI
jgi:hypothetical protein